MKTNEEFEKSARRRLRNWLRKNGYRSPEFVVRFDRDGGGLERSLYAIVKRPESDLVHDVNAIFDYCHDPVAVADWIGE